MPPLGKCPHLLLDSCLHQFHQYQLPLSFWEVCGARTLSVTSKSSINDVVIESIRVKI